jgi:uncharacterized protein YkwD
MKELSLSAATIASMMQITTDGHASPILTPTLSNGEKTTRWVRKNQELYNQTISQTLQRDSLPPAQRILPVNIHETPIDWLIKNTNPDTLQEKIIQLITDDINAIRKEQWLASLTINPILNHAAGKHAHYLNFHKKLSHAWAHHSSPSQRAYAAWYTAKKPIWENIWSAYYTIQQATQRRAASPSHYLNIVNPTFKYIGVWQAGNKRVVMFGW